MIRITRRCRASRRGAAGFTVIELLVVMAVLSVIAALLMPAVQNAREAARRVQCQSNLHQLGLAANGCEAARGTFPPSDANTPSASPHRYLLAFLDETVVYQQIDWNDISPLPPGRVPTSSSEPNSELLETTIRVFLCPSDVGRPGANNYRGCTGYGPGWATAKDATVCIDPGNATGAFVRARGTRISEFIDGLSNTALFSEKLIGGFNPDVYTPWTDWVYSPVPLCTGDDALRECPPLAYPGAQHDSYAGATWLYGGWSQTWYNHLVTPNSPIPDCGGMETNGGGSGTYAARSYHAGGVNVVFADGHVQFVSNSIDLLIWRALSTRAGKDLAQLPD